MGNLYGFSRFSHGVDKGSYYHSCMIRGNPQAVRGMIRRKIKGKYARAKLSSGEEPDFYLLPFAQQMKNSLEDPGMLPRKKEEEVQPIRLPFQNGDINPSMSQQLQKEEQIQPIRIPFQNGGINPSMSQQLRHLEFLQFPPPKESTYRNTAPRMSDLNIDPIALHDERALGRVNIDPTPLALYDERAVGRVFEDLPYYF